MEEPMDINDHIRRVRGLLAMAEDPALTEEARAAYNAKAQDMITKFAITSAQLGTNTAEDPITTERLDQWIPKRTTMVKAKRALFSALARTNHCRIVWYGSNGRDGGVIMGHTSDVMAVVALFESIVRQLTFDLAAACRAVGTRDTSFQVSFAHGYVHRVSRRLDDIQAARAADTGTPGTALVLVDRGAAVERVRDEQFKKLIKTRATFSVNSMGGMAMGDVAGARADIGQSRVGGGRQAIG